MHTFQVTSTGSRGPRHGPAHVQALRDAVAPSRPASAHAPATPASLGFTPQSTVRWRKFATDRPHQSSMRCELTSLLQ